MDSELLVGAHQRGTYSSLFNLNVSFTDTFNMEFLCMTWILLSTVFAEPVFTHRYINIYLSSIACGSEMMHS